MPPHARLALVASASAAGVSREIEDELRKRAATFNIVMEDVSITHLTFSPAYEQVGCPSART